MLVTVVRRLSVLSTLLLAPVLGSAPVWAVVPGRIVQDARHKVVTMVDGSGDLALRLNYDGKCILDRVVVRGRQVAASTGVASVIRMGGREYATRASAAAPTVTVAGNVVTVHGIDFGKPGFEVEETWRFTVEADRILWRIARHYPTDATLEDAALPEWSFQSMSTWTGGVLGNGGVVWNKYLETPNATYGAHTGSVTFWNARYRDCLRIVPTVAGGYRSAVRFSDRQNDMAFAYTVSRDELKTKHDFNRYLSDREDVWAPFSVQAGDVGVELSLQALDYDQAYDRGTFRGLDGDSVRELLNTVGRYGVVDTHLVGANGWRTGNICLHEQWFAEIGLALDDPNYDADLAATLDFERDHAIKPDGRVIARWSYNGGDAIPGTFDSFGFYEAQWGYLIDSQPDYVINVAEQFDRSGDVRWLAGQKAACERALDYLIRREVPGTGLVTVLTDSDTQKRGSDWFDVIWASYENAVVNAEFYEALTLWADSEERLGDTARAGAYRAFAARLKASFNKPIAEGGFWDPSQKWYVYWRDRDGSVHGDNLFTPVNFAAIAYGLCDDPARRKAILDGIEARMRQEGLFLWPTDFATFAPGEAMVRNYPYPNYENGDIFLSWDELGVRAYADYDPAIALKYVRNTLSRYEADGLSYQRYDRRTQSGTGDDILSGNGMAIVGLYRDIYGIQPRPDRLYLAPRLTDDLSGTVLRYTLRDRLYEIGLSTNLCSVAAAGCTLRAAAPFAVDATDTGLRFFPDRSGAWALSVSRPTSRPLSVDITVWPNEPSAPRRWTETGAKATYIVARLRPGAAYALRINGKPFAVLHADAMGRVTFVSPGGISFRAFELRPAS